MGRSHPAQRTPEQRCVSLGVFLGSPFVFISLNPLVKPDAASVAEARAHLNPQGLLVVEVGDGRVAVEHEYPRLPLIWATTSAGDDMVFVARAEDLPAQASAPRSAAA